MAKPLPDDIQDQVGQVIEDAMRRLIQIGADHDNAAALLAVQGFTRIEGDAKRLEVADLIASLTYDPDDDTDEPVTSEGETIQ